MSHPPSIAPVEGLPSRRSMSSAAEPRPSAALAVVDVERVWAAEGPGLRRLAFLLTGDVGIADDVVADAVGALLSQTGPIDRPGAWLRTVVVNRCRSVQRRRYAHRSKSHLIDSPTTAEGPSADHVELVRALRTLPADQREAVVLRFLFDLPVADVASICGTNVPAMASRIRRGLINLKGELA